MANLDRVGAEAVDEYCWRMVMVKLTPREAELMDLICLGYTTPEIANLMGIKAQTIKNSLTLIYAALGVDNRVQAALLWDKRPIAYRGKQD